MFYTTRDSEQQTFIHFTKSAPAGSDFPAMGSGQRSCRKRTETVDFFGVRNHQRHIDVAVVFKASFVVFHWISIMYPLKSKHKNGKSSFSNWGYIFNGLLLLLFASLTTPPPTKREDIQRYLNQGETEKARRNFREQIPMVLWVSGRCCWLGYVDSNFTGVVSNGCCGYRMHHEFGRWWA